MKKNTKCHIQIAKWQNINFKIENTKYTMQNTQCKTQNTKYKMQNAKYKTILRRASHCQGLRWTSTGDAYFVGETTNDHHNWQSHLLSYQAIYPPFETNIPKIPRYSKI